MKRLLILVFACGLMLSAGETVVLRSGASMRIDRHELLGDKVRLYNNAGYIELAGDLVQEFQPEEPAPEVNQTKKLEVAIPPAAQPAQATPGQLADAAADKYGLPRRLVRSVISAESGFKPDAVSPKGARGLMQLMPGTAQLLGANAADPAQNVDAGTRYLRDLLQKYDGLLYHALAAYNAGPGAVEKYKGVPPFRETIGYVNRIAREFTRSGQ